MMDQYAFLFDYEAFCLQAIPLAEAVDRGDMAPLLQAARLVAEKMKPDTWILAEYGSDLEFPSIEPATASMAGRTHYDFA